MSNFQQKTGSLGNYVWLAKIDKLNRVKEYLYSKTDTAERIRKLGWNDTEGFFDFGNGLWFDGAFKAVDELGIVRGVNDKAFYIPATSKIYIHNQEIFQFDTLVHKKPLIAKLVLLRGGCRHRCKDDGGTCCTILLQHACCRHLSHLFMGNSVLELVHSGSISNLFLTDIADTFGEILAKPSLRFRQLLSDAFFYLCHTL